MDPHRLHFGVCRLEISSGRISVFCNHLLLKIALEVREKGISGRGQWKLNMRLLENEQVCGLYTSHYKEWGSMKGDQ